MIIITMREKKNDKSIRPYDLFKLFFLFFCFFFVMNYILQSDTSFVYNATKIWSHEIYEFYS